MWCVELLETCRNVPGNDGADRPRMRFVRAQVRSLFWVHCAAFANLVLFLDYGLRLLAQLSVRTAPILGLRRRCYDAFREICYLAPRARRPHKRV